MLRGRVVIDVTADVAASPETVWPYLVDWENLGRWMKEATDFVVTSPQREGVGVTAEATVKIAGITTRDAIRVSAWEPPRILEIQHLGWVKGSGLMKCVLAKQGTSVLWRETLYPPWGIVGTLGMRIVKPLMRWVFHRDLRLLKELVESESLP